MQIGRKIYYDLTSGNVIQDTGQHSAGAVETTQEQDFQAYRALAERLPETVGMIRLEYGEYEQDFAECIGYRVGISGETPSLVFSYPDPNTPEEPPVYQKPLTEELAEVKAENEKLKSRIGQMDGDLAGFIDQYYRDFPEKA